MKCTIHIFSFCLISILVNITFVQANEQENLPKLQHGINYHKVSQISQYYVSEKLDGIRGYWDGKRLFTRQGNQIYSPQWFTKNWPAKPMDGELWFDRDQFQATLSCVNKKNPEENKAISCWRNLRFMMFDLPQHKGDFSERVKVMSSMTTQTSSPYLAMINQVKYNDLHTLEEKLNSVIAKKGEGLMLHLSSAFYKVGRNPALMKLKKHQDAEATVTGHTEGKGKYVNQLGAIKVITESGITFKIGSGFSDDQRRNPPKIGTVITFKYNGLTKAGVPRFARFWRVKPAH
jgi:DNA ligase-1